MTFWTPSSLHDGYDQRAGAVLALDVHRQSEAEGSGYDALRLAVRLGEGVAHHRHVARGTDDRPGDDVGEADALPGRLQLLASGVEHVDRNGAVAGGGGDGAALVHEAGEHGGGAADGPELGGGGGGGRSRSAVGGALGLTRGGRRRP